MNRKKWRFSSPWFPLAVYGVILLAFCLFCTRLFFKTDDGNFTGIMLSPDFSLYGFLSQRYLTWSGRTVGEALLMLFLRARWFAGSLSILACYSISPISCAGCLHGRQARSRRVNEFCLAAHPCG